MVAPQASGQETPDVYADALRFAREQAEIIADHSRRGGPIDYRFLRIHATTLLEMIETAQRQRGL